MKKIILLLLSFGGFHRLSVRAARSFYSEKEDEIYETFWQKSDCKKQKIISYRI